MVFIFFYSVIKRNVKYCKCCNTPIFFNNFTSLFKNIINSVLNIIKTTITNNANNY